MKTSELTGAALDWAVAMATGKSPHCEVHAGQVWYGAVHYGFCQYRPSEDWRQGGPIIEREGVSIRHSEKDARGAWYAVLGPNRFLSPDHEGSGPTLLIAAMRCYVASKLGDDVDLPEGLA